MTVICLLGLAASKTFMAQAKTTLIGRVVDVYQPRPTMEISPVDGHDAPALAVAVECGTKLRVGEGDGLPEQ